MMAWMKIEQAKMANLREPHSQAPCELSLNATEDQASILMGSSGCPHITAAPHSFTSHLVSVIGKPLRTALWKVWITCEHPECWNERPRHLSTGSCCSRSAFIFVADGDADTHLDVHVRPIWAPLNALPASVHVDVGPHPHQGFQLLYETRFDDEVLTIAR